MRSLEPQSKNYTDVYASAGLLTDKTIMAHCIHLDEAELSAMRSAGAGVAHCANSNCSIRSGNMDVRRVAEAGVKVGLGTDCSAGYSLSVLDAMRYVLRLYYD